MNIIDGGVCTPKGFKTSGVYCGIRKNKDKLDLAMIYAECDCKAAAVYTLNKVKGACIAVTKLHLKNDVARAIIINSGNANTCNSDGVVKAKLMCELAGKGLNISKSDVLVASTGVIGQVLPIEPIEQAMPELCAALTTNSNNAAEAILTTDTHKKECAVTFTIGEKECSIGGMAKGSGMIHPNMATLLCFITTDVNIAPSLLKAALKEITNNTFNMVSIDGDTSTNDMVIVMASSKAENKIIEDPRSAEYSKFKEGLYLVMENLSKQIAADGEGATKLLECVVNGAKSEKMAKNIAKSVITSSLFKSAMFGQDANWGRVLCAVGYAEASFNVNHIGVMLSSLAGSLIVCQGGMGVEFSEEEAAAILKEEQVRITVRVGDGEYSATAWGCDLTYDYVKINGSYRS